MSGLPAVMKLALVAALVAAAVASDVIDLTPENFDSVINGDKPALVEFFAPWCGHCKSLAPVYEDLGTTFAKYKDQVVIAKVDADAHRALGTRFDVSGFPTLKWFPKGSTTPEDFNGGRSIEDLVSFVNGKTGLNGRVKTAPSDVVVLDDDNFDKIVLDETKDVLVEFYAPWCGHCKSLAPVYDKVGTTFKSEKGVVVAKYDADKNKEKGGKYGVTGFPTIKWFPKGNKAGEEYSAGRLESDFIGFINQKSGTKRVSGGGLTADAGRIPELDELAAQFKDESSRAATLEKAQNIAESHPSEYAKFYVSVMQRILEKGAAYATSETARLAKILDGGNVKADKVDSFTIRKNILSQF